MFGLGDNLAYGLGGIIPKLTCEFQLQHDKNAWLAFEKLPVMRAH